ncbi:MAG: RIP metalloprotease [Actinomycetota bacterium]|nr:RIP metalloprotease [Actinomycetota bacterium]
MSTAIGIGAFLVTLLVMVTFHEFGHYISARRFGIKVEEFFVGFGPRLVSWWRGETEFGIKAILLGGYVRIAGMNPTQQITEEERPRTFPAKPAWQRAIVLLAGSFTHFVLATVVFTVLFAAIGVHDFTRPTTQVDEVIAEVGGKPGPARVAGLEPGDRIVAISGRPVRSWEQVREAIRPNAGRELIFEVERGQRRLGIPVTPIEADAPDPENPERTVKAGQVGIAPAFPVVRRGPVAAFGEAAKTTGRMIVASVQGAGKIFSPEGLGGVFEAVGGQGTRDLSEDQPIGLVGGARLAGQATSAGQVESLIFFLGGFIVFVGVINLAPLPPLDGGHLLVLLVEKISRKAVDPRKLIPVSGLVLAFLLILSVALLYLDVARPITDPFQ